MNESSFAIAYLIASVLFIFGLKGLSSPKTALRGNLYAMFGMTIAILVTAIHPEVRTYTWIVLGILAGAFIGIPLALKINMKAMPQLVAILHSFVGLSAVLVAFGTYFSHQTSSNINSLLIVELAVGSFIGAITFTGSLVSFAKLQEIIPSAPLIFKGQHILNLILTLIMLCSAFYFAISYDLTFFIIMTIIACLLGFLLVLPIGGADMPVIVSMLNSYSGWAASATGFTLNNYLLITTGALVGSSGAILSYIMCKAMNRSFLSVIFGGFGTEQTVTNSKTTNKNIKSASSDDMAFMLGNSSKAIIIPGYGMAVSQAQHSIKEIFNLLHEKGVDIKFAIHPVAGRMPGHMNVLLAESDIPYDVVFEMEEINSEFSSTDVVIVVGANDIVNPAAKTDKASPLFGMPILEAYKAKQIFVLKRSMNPGYAGVDNDIFYYDNCYLVFGDAKATCEQVIKSLHEA